MLDRYYDRKKSCGKWVPKEKKVKENGEGLCDDPKKHKIFSEKFLLYHTNERFEQNFKSGRLCSTNCKISDTRCLRIPEDIGCALLLCSKFKVFCDKGDVNVP